MAKEKESQADRHGFSIDLDESLIADALAAVERRLEDPADPGELLDFTLDDEIPGDAGTGGAPGAAPPAGGPAADETPWHDLDDEPILAMGPAEGMPMSLGAPARDDTAAEEEVIPTREQLLELNAQLGEELELLEDEREQLSRALAEQREAVQALIRERDEARERAREALRKAGLMVMKARRKDELIEQLQLDLQDARAMLHQRDQSIRELRASIREEEHERERLRSRHARESAESKRFANERLLKNLLPVLDHMELALAHADADPTRIREGVEITWKQLLSVLERTGLTRVDIAVGAPFDPEVQEAMEYVDHDEIPAHHVVHIYQNGYLLSGRLLRAARVAVSSEQPLDAPSDGSHSAASEE